MYSENSRTDELINAIKEKPYARNVWIIAKRKQHKYINTSVEKNIIKKLKKH